LSTPPSRVLSLSSPSLSHISHIDIDTTHGRYEGELLLREDQLLTGIWRQKSVKVGLIYTYLGPYLVSYLSPYLTIPPF